MQTWARYLLLVLGIVISLHFILSVTQEDYGRATSLASLTSQLKGGSKQPSPQPVPDDYYIPTGEANSTLAVDRRANATFVILARNSDVSGAVRSVRDIEDRFNRGHGYPYVFLNEEPFSEEFKSRVSVLSGSLMEFGLIPPDHWNQPDWIDEDKARAGREKMVADKIIYGGSVSYRNMCRFNSGFFFRHPLVQKYRWYWRIEPEVHFHCDIGFDPFLFMEDNNKVYSFTITMYEFEKTISTLWEHVRKFMKMHPEYVAEDNAMGFMSHDGGNKYNLCHFWSNFEIADMDFWRGPAYTAFFEYLDSTGGFYYERWGDAPVHSIAAAIFAKKDQIHFFDEIGYEHNPYIHCPQSKDTWKRGRCSCDQAKSFDYDGYSCMRHWDKFMKG
ncbi:Glycolipid 2-alpha-mannosyltransferase 2 [Hypsizygus marmoreus]|uniref:Glycolipid 2-alpha-mannosyltransferase 2 n=1 Tax=Hypsizygus marmoreus TaxID=39966 RepID=A0A369JHU0_HYPMA|nr:Glycolipid 2-alpha-mannosyltransferase 2 [Hypsizygus marmoreus]